jgi:hypothetical protein
MAKEANYDPNAEYEVVKGPVSIKDAKTNNRTILQTGDKTKLSHLTPAQVAFLVEAKGVYKLAGSAK